MMQSLDPKRLIDLLRVVEHGSYTRAAEARGVSQPALSNSIGGLERQLGLRLLNRDRRGITPTDYGALLVEHAKTLEALLSRASQELELKRSGLLGSLRIGMTPVAAAQ